MNFLNAYGFPFNPNHSSCSNRTPKNFLWKLPKDPNLDTLVLIDYAITQHDYIPPTVKSLYGWICESRSIVPHVMNYIIWNHEKLKTRFQKIFVSDRTITEISDLFIFCPAGSNLPWIPEHKYEIYEKTKLASMVASAKRMTKSHALRHEYADKFKDKLDLFGGACGSPRLPETDVINPWFSKLNGLKDYMFSVVIENDFYDGYYTEKITDCFATGTIPVYLGNPAIIDIFNKDGIILLDEKFDINSLTSDLYYSKMEAIKDNMERVKNLENSDDTLWRLINESRSI